MSHYPSTSLQAVSAPPTALFKLLSASATMRMARHHHNLRG